MYKKGIFILFSLFFSYALSEYSSAQIQKQDIVPAPGGSETQTEPVVSKQVSNVEIKDNLLSVELIDAEFGNVLNDIALKSGFKIEINGDISSKKLTTKFNGIELERGIIRLMSLINEKNYMFYYDTKGALSGIDIYGGAPAPVMNAKPQVPVRPQVQRPVRILPAPTPAPVVQRPVRIPPISTPVPVAPKPATISPVSTPVPVAPKPATISPVSTPIPVAPKPATISPVSTPIPVEQKPATISPVSTPIPVEQKPATISPVQTTAPVEQQPAVQKNPPQALRRLLSPQGAKQLETQKAVPALTPAPGPTQPQQNVEPAEPAEQENIEESVDEIPYVPSPRNPTYIPPKTQ